MKGFAGGKLRTEVLHVTAETVDEAVLKHVGNNNPCQLVSVSPVRFQRISDSFADVRSVLVVVRVFDPILDREFNDA